MHWGDKVCGGMKATLLHALAHSRATSPTAQAVDRAMRLRGWYVLSFGTTMHPSPKDRDGCRSHVDCHLPCAHDGSKLLELVERQRRSLDAFG